MMKRARGQLLELVIYSSASKGPLDRTVAHKAKEAGNIQEAPDA